MTIEIATPSSGETLAAIFDTLVGAVAARVLARLERLEQVVAQLDEKLDNKLDLDFAERDLDGKIDEWAANFLQDRFDEHVTIRQDDDLHDQVLDIVQSLTFEIDVIVRK